MITSTTQSLAENSWRSFVAISRQVASNPDDRVTADARIANFHREFEAPHATSSYSQRIHGDQTHADRFRGTSSKRKYFLTYRSRSLLTQKIDKTVATVNTKVPVQQDATRCSRATCLRRSCITAAIGKICIYETEH